MALKTFTAEITPTGEVKVEISGYQDSSCDALAKILIGGDTITSEIKKPEYQTRISNMVKK